MVSNVLQQFANADFDPQFLPQFTDKTRFKGLARFAFATWKLPKAALMRLCVTTGDQKLAVAEDESRTDFHCD